MGVGDRLAIETKFSRVLIVEQHNQSISKSAQSTVALTSRGQDFKNEAFSV